MADVDIWGMLAVGIITFIVGTWVGFYFGGHWNGH